MTDAQRVEAQSERLRYATVAWLRLLKQTEGGPSVERVASDTMIALAAVLAHEGEGDQRDPRGARSRVASLGTNAWLHA